MSKETMERLTAAREKVRILRGFLDEDTLRSRAAELEARVSSPEFWSDPSAGRMLQELTRAREGLGRIDGLSAEVDEYTELARLVEAEGDESLSAELDISVQQLGKRIRAMELEHMLSGADDHRDAILTIHPGAGGIESMDWAAMLSRMYQRWAERHGHAWRVLDMSPGEEAGVKSLTAEVAGVNAYGYLKAERGVHRLVRISPFDASRRRHTSFASVSVLPEIDDTITVEIGDKDLRVDTFRASGAGGQHVNKTSSAVRITHIPTGTVVQCQSERSQHRNRENAMKILMSRLYQRQMEEEEAKRLEIQGEKTDIAWGNQIRSYVLQPYSLVKDHRTDLSDGNVQAILDGAIDQFIEGFLLRS
ncbi:MAG: peptide chain release factor 2 [Candidatus Eisenbacteria bacterium]|nr:peptide chain release factor 2 [Candidatus Eisenbacteria bacterium]